MTSAYLGATVWRAYFRQGKTNFRRALVLGLGLVAFAFGLSVQAETYNDEVSQLVRAGRSVKALGPSLFGDQVNGYTGALEFVQSDVSIPGNNALNVGVARRLARTYSAYHRYGIFGEWELDIPHLQGVFSVDTGWTSAAAGNSRCSQFGNPGNAWGVNGYSQWAYEEYWGGNLLYVPGQGETEILLRTDNTPASPTDGASYPLVTKQQWAFRCGIDVQSNAYYSSNGISDKGEGFIGRSPDGTIWRFDWLVRRTAARLTRNSWSPTVPLSLTVGADAPTDETPNMYADPALNRVEVWILPTEARDRFGNTVTYDYDPALPWHLRSITASDGRHITLNYDGTSDLVSSVSDGTRTWIYTYNNGLASVTQPDGTQLTIAGAGDFVASNTASPDYGCNASNSPLTSSGVPSTITFTHPSGALGSFTYDFVTHARSYVPRECIGDPLEGARYPRFFNTRSVISKQISGPGLTPLVWNYSYSDPNGQGSWDTDLWHPPQCQ